MKFDWNVMDLKLFLIYYQMINFCIINPYKVNKMFGVGASNTATASKPFSNIAVFSM